MKHEFELPKGASLILNVLNLHKANWAIDIVEEYTNVVRERRCEIRKSIFHNAKKEELFLILEEQIKKNNIDRFELSSIPSKYWISFIVLESFVRLRTFFSYSLSCSYTPVYEIVKIRINLYVNNRSNNINHEKAEITKIDQIERRKSSPIERLTYGLWLAFERAVRPDRHSKYDLNDKTKNVLIEALPSEMAKYSFQRQGSLQPISSAEVLEEALSTAWKKLTSKGYLVNRAIDITEEIARQIEENFVIAMIDRGGWVASLQETSIIMEGVKNN